MCRHHCDASVVSVDADPEALPQALSPAHLNFVLHILHEKYLHVPGVARELLLGLMSLARFSSNATALADHGACHCLINAAIAHAHSPDDAQAVYASLSTMISATGGIIVDLRAVLLMNT